MVGVQEVFMKIIQITSTVAGGEGRGHYVYGLGDDGKLYRWSFTSKTWDSQEA